jgi:hypothetical protein
MTEMLWSRPICKVAGDYLAWPTVAACASGEVLVIFSGDREEHVCPYGKTLLIRSGDGGETWTEPAIINSTPLDDRDAGIIELASGTLVMSWFTYATWEHFDAFRALDRWEPAQIDAWVRHCSKVPEEARRAWLGSWTRRSTDGGRTWEPPVPSIVSAPHGRICSVHPVGTIASHPRLAQSRICSYVRSPYLIVRAVVMLPSRCSRKAS